MIHLFGFASKRYPQTIGGTARSDFFIEITPQVRAISHYFTGLNPGNFRALRKEFRSRASTFSRHRSLAQIRTDFADRLALFERARRPAQAGLSDDLRTMVQELEAGSLSIEDQTTLWDNLIHSIWITASQAEVDAIIGVFVGERIAQVTATLPSMPESLDPGTIAHLRKVARARVVISMPLENPSFTINQTPLSRRQRKLLEAAHDRFVVHYEADALDGAIHSYSAALKIRRRDVDAAAAQERQTREARLNETLRDIEISAMASFLPSLRNALSSPSRVPINSREVYEHLSDGHRRHMARFVTDERSAPDALALANSFIANARSDAPVAHSTVHHATFYAFGTEISIEERIPAGAMIVRGVTDAQGGMHYYLTYHHAQTQPLLAVVVAHVAADGRTLTDGATPLPNLHEDFQTFRLTPEPVLSTNAEVRLQFVRADGSLSDALSIPPIAMFGTFSQTFQVNFGDSDPEVPTPPPVFGVHALGIIDFWRVEQELSCYVKSDVSHIENIMASEYKEKVARSLSILETEEEVTNEFSSERTSDTETAKKLEMQTVVNSVLNEETARGFDFSTGVAGEFPGGSVTTTIGFNNNSTTSRQDSNSEALTFAETVTRRVQEKIVQKQTGRRRALARREHEVTSKHGFDNRDGLDHVVGVYRWVDKIMDNHLVNYGRRAVLEFELAEPARNFIRAQESAAEQNEFKRKPPRTPRMYGLTAPKALTRENYSFFAHKFSVLPDSPPVEWIYLTKAFKQPPGETGAALGTPSEGREGTDILSAAVDNEMQIPDGYVARTAKFWAAPKAPGAEGTYSTSIFVSVGDSAFYQHTETGDGVTELRDISGVSGNLSVAIVAWNLEYAVTVRVDCQLTDEAFRAWQLATYNMIVDAYRKQRDEYDAANTAHEAEQQGVNLNPRFKRAMMDRELKRLCIEMMTRPFGIDLARDHYQPGADGEFDSLVQSPVLERHARQVRFFEEVIDWELAAYRFYPYFYSDRTTWSAKIAMEATSSSIFDAFLSAGMARIVVPIRKGFEDAVGFYMESGEVWFGGGFVLDVRNDHYLSLAEEMLDSQDEAFVKQTWQTRLPTDLTILQERSAALIEEGLPCAVVEDKLAIGESRLRPVSPSPGNS